MDPNSSYKNDSKNTEELQWLSIKSFPDFPAFTPQETNQSSAVSKPPNEEDHYVEFDYELFSKKFEHKSSRSKKYSKNPEKMFQRARKLRRKALVDLSHQKPMLIDKFDPIKLNFFISLRPDTALRIQVSRPKYHKLKGLVPLYSYYNNKNLLGFKRYFLEPQNVQNLYYGSEQKFSLSSIMSVPSFSGNIICSDEDKMYGVTSKITLLNKKVNENPSNIDAWLELVDLQQEKYGPKCSDAVISNSQLSVLEKALSKNPTSEILLLRQLYITHNASDPTSLRSVLDQTVFNFPNKISFWLAYFEYNMADFSKLTQTRVCDMYVKALTKLESLKSDLVRVSHQLLEPLGSQHQFRLFSQLALYLLSSDNSEKLVSIFQSLIDFNLTCAISSEAQKLKPQALKLYFETYWDSGVPHFGESSSNGFLAFMKKNTSESIFKLDRSKILEGLFDRTGHDQSFYDTLETNAAKSRFEFNQSWVLVEKIRSSYQVMPLRSDVETEDSERIVLFDDISSFLFRIDSSLHFELCLLFLLVLGVPIPHTACPLIKEHFYDNLLTSDFILQLPHLLAQFEAITGGYNLYIGSILSPIWVHFGSDEPAFHVPPDTSTLHYIRTLFAQLLSVSVFNDTQHRMLSVIWLQFEILTALLHPDPNNENFSNLLILSKRLLELPENRSHSPIWILYSFCLFYSGKKIEYIKTMNRLVKTFINRESDMVTAGVFVRFFAETALLNNLFDHLSPDTISSYIHDIVYSSLKVDYKSPEEFNNALVRMVSNITTETIVHCADLIICQFLQTLLLGDIHTAINNFTKWVQFCRERCKIDHSNTVLKCLQLPYENYDSTSPLYHLCKLIVEHFAITVWHPSLSFQVDFSSLSNIMHVCLSMFPHSVPIHQWYYQFLNCTFLSSSFQICYNRLLTLVLQPTSKQLCCWVYSVYSELSFVFRLLQSQTTPDLCSLKDSPSFYRLRSSFEKVCSHPSFRFRPLVWRLYMRILKLFNDLDGLTAAFYRALQHTPWCKEIYLDAALFKILSPQSISDLMIEKGIRLRLPVEEVELLISADKDT